MIKQNYPFEKGLRFLYDDIVLFFIFFNPLEDHKDKLLIYEILKAL